MKIVLIVHYYVITLSLKFNKDPSFCWGDMHKILLNMHARGIYACAKFQYTRVHVFASCACILPKKILVAHYSVINLSFRFHKDLICRWRDICKIELCFFLASTYLSISQTILVYIGLSRSILDFLGLSKSFLVYLCFSISGYLGQSWAISWYLGLSQVILSYLGLSWARMRYLGYLLLSLLRMQFEAAESKLLLFEAFSFFFRCEAI